MLSYYVLEKYEAKIYCKSAYLACIMNMNEKIKYNKIKYNKIEIFGQNTLKYSSSYLFPQQRWYNYY